MRNLKRAQQTFVEQFMRCQAGDVFARHEHTPGCGRQYTRNHIK